MNVLVIVTHTHTVLNNTTSNLLLIESFGTYVFDAKCKIKCIGLQRNQQLKRMLNHRCAMDFILILIKYTIFDTNRITRNTPDVFCVFTLNANFRLINAFFSKHITNNRRLRLNEYNEPLNIKK